MAASSSSSWQGRQGSGFAAAPAAPQGPSIRVATLNLGVFDEGACASDKKWPLFRNKLDADLDLLISHGVQIICLQEVNQFWAKEIRSILPLWNVIQGGNKVLIAFRPQEWDEDIKMVSKPCFDTPVDAGNPHRWWRKYLEAGQWMCPEMRMCDFGKFTCLLRRSGFPHLNT